VADSTAARNVPLPWSARLVTRCTVIACAVLLLVNAAIIANLFIFSPLYGGIKKPPHIRLSCGGIFARWPPVASPAGFFCVDYSINSSPLFMISLCSFCIAAVSVLLNPYP
ncbi:hypothetical protein, partial [Thiolapillus sp.]|uniref:hypothetical protein n=1 Tax=Thiolapillus sp. TaxID=2017437 RepID=UPI003AF7CFB0